MATSQLTRLSGVYITTTNHPQVPNCTACDNMLVGRDDGMAVHRVQERRRGKRWPTIAWLCEPCARDERVGA